MISVKWTFLLFVVVDAAFSVGTGIELDDQQDEAGITVQNSVTAAATGTLCDKDTCKISECKCCPGYGLVMKQWFWGSDSCKKCDCGKVFNCKFDSSNLKTCLCPSGYDDISGICKDKCSLIHCQNGGRCDIENGKAVCNCTDKYTGDNCEKEICNKKCMNKGQCIVEGGEDFCRCTDEYSGELCEKKKCDEKLCQNKGKCIVKDGIAVCNCTNEYTGDLCEKRCDCKNGKCKEISGEIECICNPEYGLYEKGFCKDCECGRGINCTFNESGIWPFKATTKTCLCPKGYLQADGKCVDPDTHNPCHNDPCQNGATCSKNGVQAECVCLPGYSGKFCENDVCAPNPCKNGGTCQRDTGTAVCACKDAYTGKRCEKDKCSLIHCQNGGRCDIENGKAVCNCTDKYTGDNCEKVIGPCFFDSCENGGTCIRDGNNFKCVCVEPFTGTFCEKNPCSNEPCLNGGQCSLHGKSFKCTCKEPFTGKFCEYDMCARILCKNDGICKVDQGVAKCFCKEPYSGEFCDAYKDFCVTNICRNGGICRTINGDAKCFCLEPYGGKFCHTRTGSLGSTTIFSVICALLILVIISCLVSHRIRQRNDRKQAYA